MVKVTMFDPPKGWAYGFPKVMPEKCIGNEQQTKFWLYQNGYPFEMLDLALKHGRRWEVDMQFDWEKENDS